MPDLKCPVCGGILIKKEKTYNCPSGHSYDIASQGYVNLLMSNGSSGRRHGDDKAMAAARTAFLDKGYYSPLRDAVCDSAVRNTGAEVDMLDAGCGEGWYTFAVKEAIEKAGGICRVCAVDISRDAVKRMSKRGRGATLVVAGINALPVPDASCDLILNIFAPSDGAEFARALKPGGILIRAVPLEDHLMGLKRAVYERPYLNASPDGSLPDGFALVEREEIRETLVLNDPEDIKNLFMMTPYYYKTGREDQRKLLALERLETEISFCVFSYKKG